MDWLAVLNLQSIGFHKKASALMSENIYTTPYENS
jgi:hypothetical protein